MNFFRGVMNGILLSLPIWIGLTWAALVIGCAQPFNKPGGPFYIGEGLYVEGVTLTKPKCAFKGRCVEI